MAQLKSLADAPGTSREYETIYVLRPGLTNDEVAEVNGRVRGIIENMGGKVLKVDNWGKRRLAYEISKERKGIYLYWQYLAGSGVVDEFERNMRMLDSVIRYMTVKLDSSVDPEARPSDVDEETYEKAANTAADEEDMFLQRPADEGEEKPAEAAAEGEEKPAEAKAEGEEKPAEAKAEGEEKPAEAKAEGEEKPAEAKAEAEEKPAEAAEAAPAEAAPAEAAAETTDDSSDDAKDKE